MPLTPTPQILGEDKIYILPGSASNVMPTVFTSAIAAQEFINKMPQFFTEKEKIDYKVLASKTARNILGSRAAIGDPLTVYYTSAFLQAHAQMVAWQAETAGCFWLVWYIKSQDRTVGCRLTIDDHAPTPTDESGGLAPIDIVIANVDESIEASGDVTGTASLQALTVTCTDGVTAAMTAVSVAPAEPYAMSAVYKTSASVTLPALNDVLVVGTGNWLPFTSGAEYTATNGHQVGVVYIETLTKKAKYAGYGIAIVA